MWQTAEDSQRQTATDQGRTWGLRRGFGGAKRTTREVLGEKQAAEGRRGGSAGAETRRRLLTCGRGNCPSATRAQSQRTQKQFPETLAPCQAGRSLASRPLGRQLPN